MEDTGDNNHIVAESDGGENIEENTEEGEQFDISLAASHTYMGPGLVTVSGRCVLEAGWEGQVPVVGHHGTVFPGETVPMMLPNAHDAAILERAIKQDKLFGLLCPDDGSNMISGYGVLCEVFEVRAAEAYTNSPFLTFKARANHRFQIVNKPKHALPIDLYTRVRLMKVRVLPELQMGDPLRHMRLASLDPLRRGCTLKDKRLRKMDAVVSPWPLFVYDICDYSHMRQLIKDYFKMFMLDKLPEDPVSLSFWVASNLVLSARDRFALFAVDDVLLRLHMEVQFIKQKSVLCCAWCVNEIAQQEHIFAMSTEGVHSNYTNLGGYMHDVVTVSTAFNTELSGAPSSEFSWFPGYTWTIVLCATCMSHLGWRFDAIKKNLRPQQFYGLCRNYVQPRSEVESETMPAYPSPLYLD